MLVVPRSAADEIPQDLSDASPETIALGVLPANWRRALRANAIRPSLLIRSEQHTLALQAISAAMQDTQADRNERTRLLDSQAPLLCRHSSGESLGLRRSHTQGESGFLDAEGQFQTVDGFGDSPPTASNWGRKEVETNSRSSDTNAREADLLNRVPLHFGFDEPESEANILYVESATTGNNSNVMIKAATLTKLVAHLTTSGEVGDRRLGDDFLLTYRSFTTPQELLAILKARFAVTRLSQSAEQNNQDVSLRIRLRVVNILKRWVDRHYYDFEADPRLQHAFLDFVDNTVLFTPPAKAMETAAVQLRNMIQKKVICPIRTQLAMATVPPPTPLQPKKIIRHLLDMHPTEIARQLTLIESHLFKQIRPKECLSQSWNKAKLKVDAPNILNLIDRFNQVSRWVASEVVQEEKIRPRARVVRLFVEVAHSCVQYNAFNVVQEIIAALLSASVGRLKLTWREMQPRTMQQWASVKQAMSQDGNWKGYRARLEQCGTPCLPYLGVFLSDLTFVEEGNPDNIETSAGSLINFVKRRAVAKIITSIQDFQSTPYNFQPVAQLQEIIQARLVEAHTWSEDALYKASLLAEPRSPKKT